MITIIILAAGLSSRMELGNKLLLPYKDKCIFAKVVDNLTAVQLEGVEKEVIIVLGKDAEKIKAIIEQKNVTFAVNPEYRKGMLTSIQAGVKMADTKSKGFVICLGDMPLITTAEYHFLISSFLNHYANNDRCITLPFFQNKKGNPVIFSKHYRNAILKHKALEGCRLLVQNHQKEWHRISMPSPHILKDIDNRAAYEDLIKTEQ